MTDKGLKEAVHFMSDLLFPQYIANTGVKIEVRDTREMSVCYVYELKDKIRQGRSTLEPVFHMVRDFRIARVYSQHLQNSEKTISDICNELGIIALNYCDIFESPDKEGEPKYRFVVRLSEEYNEGKNSNYIACCRKCEKTKGWDQSGHIW